MTSPDPQRLALLRTACRTTTLDRVAEHVAALAALTPAPRHVGVERHPDGYRWTVVHKGGPYPLLREVAQFLGVPHDGLVVGSRPFELPWCALQLGPDDGASPVATAVIDLRRVTDPDAVAAQLVVRLGGPPDAGGAPTTTDR
jgi:hypothetical protein